MSDLCKYMVTVAYQKNYMSYATEHLDYEVHAHSRDLAVDMATAYAAEDGHEVVDIYNVDNIGVISS